MPITKDVGDIVKVSGKETNDVPRAVNRLLDNGYDLLHVGSEWDFDGKGHTRQYTVAILGKLKSHHG